MHDALQTAILDHLQNGATASGLETMTDYGGNTEQLERSPEALSVAFPAGFLMLFDVRLGAPTNVDRVEAAIIVAERGLSQRREETATQAHGLALDLADWIRKNAAWKSPELWLQVDLATGISVSNFRVKTSHSLALVAFTLNIRTL